MVNLEKNRKLQLTLMSALLVTCVIISIGLGRYWITPAVVVETLVSGLFGIATDFPDEVGTVIYQVRLPRVIMGVLVGIGLAAAGCAYQSIFQNPMVSPDLLGASNGAGLGAALGLFFGLGYRITTLMAFCMGLLAVGLVSLITSRAKGNVTLVLVLTGMMVGSLATACLSYIKLIADPTNQLPAITYWLMGSLASIKQQDVFFASPLIIVGLIPLYLLRWRINVLAMGDDQAKTMGVNVKQLRYIIVFSATLLTAACVSVSGIVGWVGLVIPHFARMLIGSDCRYTIPASMLLGGSFLLIVDNFARLMASSEIPLGILTAFVGAPFFLFLILREGKKL